MSTIIPREGRLNLVVGPQYIWRTGSPGYSGYVTLVQRQDTDEISGQVTHWDQTQEEDEISRAVISGGHSRRR